MRVKIEIGGYHVKARVGIKKQRSRRVLSMYLSIFAKDIHYEDFVISLGEDVNVEWVGRGKYGLPKGEGKEAGRIIKKKTDALAAVESALKELERNSDQIDGKLIRSTIQGAIDLVIGGKPPRGLRESHIATIKKRTLRNICNEFLKNKAIQKKNYLDSVRFYEERFGEGQLISQVTSEKLVEFKQFLYEKCLHNSAVTYLRKLNGILIYAEKKGMISKNPMPERFIGRCKPGGVRSLTTIEIDNIKGLDEAQLTAIERKVRCLLLLQISSGLGYSELKSLRAKDIVETETGLSFDAERKKTNQPYFVPLSPLAEEMYKRLAGHGDYPFGDLFTVEFFIRVSKQVALKAGIGKNITSTTGRKTFATQWVLAGNSLYELSKILGHTDIKQTTEYVRFEKQMIEKNATKAYANMPFLLK